MKATLAIVTTCAGILLSTYVFADCGNGGCQQSGNCGGASEYENVCQCTDPVCNSVDRGCLSKAECCEAFGNVGAR